MGSLAVIEHFDVVEDSRAGLFSRGKPLVMDEFILEIAEEALNHGIVVAIAPATGNLLTTTTDVGTSPHFSATTRLTYNGMGQVAATTDALGVVTQFGYDASGNQTSIVRDVGPGHLNQTTTMGYDAVGNATAVTDPNGNVTRSTFDALRRPPPSPRRPRPRPPAASSPA